MAKDSDHLAGSFEIENTGGVLAGLLAEEDQFDRRTLWRLGSWGSAAVGTLIVAALDDWEQCQTEAVIRRLDLIPDPAERLRAVMAAAIADRILETLQKASPS